MAYYKWISPITELNSKWDPSQRRKFTVHVAAGLFQICFKVRSLQNYLITTFTIDIRKFSVRD